MSYDQMVCLVGENPLPIYLSIRQFASRNADVFLIHSGKRADNPDLSTGTAGVAQRIASAFGDKPHFVPLDDPYSPKAVEDVFDHLFKQRRVNESAALNYTGGTKVMSAQAVLAWKECGGDMARTIYLQEDTGQWRLGDGDRPDLDVDLSLEGLVSLHGPVPNRAPWTIDVKKQDLLAILGNAGTFGFPDYVGYEWLKGNINQPESPWAKFRECLTDQTKAKWAAWETEAFPHSSKEFYGSRFQRMLEFAHGKWLEDLVERLIKCLTNTGQLNYDVIPSSGNALVQAKNVYSGQPFKILGQQFESDVVCLVGHRLCYFSMSTNPGTDTRAKVLKAKMFEAVYRSQQLGGGLARSCVVSLAGNKRVDECRASLGNNSRRTIFGLPDLQNWLGGEAETLYEFLTQ